MVVSLTAVIKLLESALVLVVMLTMLVVGGVLLVMSAVVMVDVMDTSSETFFSRLRPYYMLTWVKEMLAVGCWLCQQW